MWEKHKKLIFAQVAGMAAVVAFIMAWMRYQQTGIFQEGTLGSFLGFGVLLVIAEIKCIYDWVKARRAEKTLKPVEQ